MKLYRTIGILIACLLCCQTGAGAVSVSASGLETQTKDAETETMNRVTAEDQSIGLAGVQNARELGGYVTESGKKIKRGLLLRTAKLADAAEEDIEKLKNEYHLGTIVDFRTTSEIEEAPNPEISGVENVEIRILDENGIAGSMAASMASKENQDPVGSCMELVKAGYFKKDRYVSMVEAETAKNGYREFFRILLNNEEGKAILFHCSSGKDRTGIAAAFILAALGVDEKTILDDFELTNDFLSETISYMETETEKRTDDQEIIEGVKALTGVSREYMEILIDYLKEKYGSVCGYITQELRITEKELETLKDMYLE